MSTSAVCKRLLEIPEAKVWPVDGMSAPEHAAIARSARSMRDPCEIHEIDWKQFQLRHVLGLRDVLLLPRLAFKVAQSSTDHGVQCTMLPTMHVPGQVIILLQVLFLLYGLLATLLRSKAISSLLGMLALLAPLLSPRFVCGV